MPKDPAAPKRRYVRRKSTIAPDDQKALVRIATSLERLVGLQEATLNARGIPISIAPSKEEGEILVTDDAEVATLLERLLLNRPINDRDRGIYIGDAPGGGIPTPEEGQTTEVGNPASAGRFGPVLFGSNWGFNRGPEGAEEGGASFDSIGGASTPTPGAIPR